MININFKKKSLQQILDQFENISERVGLECKDLDETLVNHFGNIRCISDQASWVDYNDDHIDCFDADGVILADSADLIIFDDSKLLQAIEKVEKDAELLEQEKQATIDEMFSFLVDSLKETCESIVEEANEKIEYKINTRDGHHHQISFDGCHSYQ